ncbi:MAG: hypothetical protein FJ285_03055 [Planctomycetes bacterium]|nr:hypothetical protein [Planctomycetota bacterium]
MSASKTARAWGCVLLAMLPLLGGCRLGSVSRAYPGVSEQQLWSATVLAARQPELTDWFVTENGVFVDEATHQIEIHRELKRDVMNGQAMRRQTEIWSFSIEVDASDRIPRVIMQPRGRVRGGSFFSQSDQFFRQIDARLAQHPSMHDGLTPPAANVEATGGLEAPISHDPSPQQRVQPSEAPVSPTEKPLEPPS